MRVLKLTKWMTVHLAWLTMTISPVAFGYEAENLSKQQLQQYINEFGLNKKTTLGEFWNKSKAYYPGYMYREIEAFVQQNKNLEMPQMTVSSSKTTNGTEVPMLQLSQNGKIQTIQFYGEKDKWAKLNNAVLSMADLERPSDLFARVTANDIRLKKEFDSLQSQANGKPTSKNMTPNQKKMTADLGRFEGFPRVTPYLWKSMTLQQRASYIVKMRLMYMSALEVTKHLEPQKAAKTFLELLMGAEAYAQKPVVNAKKLERTAIKSKNTTVTTRSGKTVNIPESAKACIVAGYVGAEGVGSNVHGSGRKVCSLDTALGLYEGTNAPSYVREANNTCIKTHGSTARACNPMQYSFPKGEPLCIDQIKTEFQDATTRNGLCDLASPLSSAKMVMEFNSKNYENVMPDSARQKIIEDDQKLSEFQYTKDFIEGMLKQSDNGRNKKLFDIFTKGVWDEDLDKELVQIQSVYEQETNRAIAACRENIEKLHVDTKQKPACDQLHRRWLFTEKFISEIRSKACPSDSTYIGAYAKDESMVQSGVIATDTEGKSLTKTELNKRQLTDPKGKGLCKCNADGSTADFGGQCKSNAAVVPPAVAVEKESPAPVIDKSCPSGTNIIQDGDGVQCQCVKGEGKMLPQSTKPEDVERLCEKSDLWKWLLGGLGILALVALFHKNKKPKQPPVVVPPSPPICKISCKSGSTLNPVSCTCSPKPPVKRCRPPKVGKYPACACPVSNSCTPGQQIYNQSTCQCTNVVQPVICPNGNAAPNNNLSQCPKCTNGSYEPLAGCPAPSEGGSGDNCPSGNCSGGAPTEVNQ